MTRILVVAAMDVEARALARHLGLLRVAAGRDAHYHGRGVDVVRVGPRAPQLTRVVELARAAALVVSAGTCGALAPHLGEGDLVVPEFVLSSAGRRHVVSEIPGLVRAGTLLTVDEVVETARVKARLWRETAALAVDMESAVVMQWAASLDVPAVAVRGVVDTAASGIAAAFAGIVDDRGRTRIGRAIQVILTRPRALREALTLRRTTAQALQRVAHAVRLLAPEGQGAAAAPPDF